MGNLLSSIIEKTAERYKAADELFIFLNFDTAAQMFWNGIPKHPKLEIDGEALTLFISSGMMPKDNEEFLLHSSLSFSFML